MEDVGDRPWIAGDDDRPRLAGRGLEHGPVPEADRHGQFDAPMGDAAESPARDRGGGRATAPQEPGRRAAYRDLQPPLTRLNALRRHGHRLLKISNPRHRPTRVSGFRPRAGAVASLARKLREHVAGEALVRRLKRRRVRIERAWDDDQPRDPQRATSASRARTSSAGPVIAKLSMKASSSSCAKPAAA
jgi:hypothetical protein